MSSEHPVSAPDSSTALVPTDNTPLASAPASGTELATVSPAPAGTPVPWLARAGVVNPQEEKLPLKSIDYLMIATSLPSVLMGLAIVAGIFWVRSMKPLDSLVFRPRPAPA